MEDPLERGVKRLKRETSKEGKTLWIKVEKGLDEDWMVEEETKEEREE